MSLFKHQHGALLQNTPYTTLLTRIRVPANEQDTQWKQIRFIRTVKRSCASFALQSHCTFAQAPKPFGDFLYSRVTEVQYTTSVYHGSSATRRTATHGLTSYVNEDYATLWTGTSCELHRQNSTLSNLQCSEVSVLADHSVGNAWWPSVYTKGLAQFVIHCLLLAHVWDGLVQLNA